MIRHAAVLSLSLLTACAARLEDIGTVPALKPVGAGLTATGSTDAARLIPVSVTRTQPAWEGSRADLYRDRRARHVGDVITVHIAIDDKASLDSNLNRTRKGETDGSLGLGFAWLGETLTDIAGNGNVETNSTAKNQGSIARAEKINLDIAAVVTRVLPNGNLMISGTQEVRVNFEVRSLSVAGIVRPGDISSDNTIAYDRIAEARVSYGGRGRVSEIQQPGAGQQVFDLFSPF